MSCSWSLGASKLTGWRPVEARLKPDPGSEHTHPCSSQPSFLTCLMKQEEVQGFTSGGGQIRANISLLLAVPSITSIP